TIRPGLRWGMPDMSLTHTTSRRGWTHSFPVTRDPDETNMAFSSADKAECVAVMNVLLAAGFDVLPALGESRTTKVAAAVLVKWSVHVAGDVDVVAAACAAAGEWIRGGGR